MIHRIASAVSLTLLVPIVITHGAADATSGRKQAAAGVIEGRVTFEGPPPAAVAVAESGGTQAVLHIDAARGLQYAVVYLPDAPRTVMALPLPFLLHRGTWMTCLPVSAERAG